jgi:hypothetical protein
MYKRFKHGYFLWALMTSLVFQACHIRQLQPSKSQVQRIQPHPFHCLIIHSSINIKNGTNQYKLHVQFRIQRDKLIWFSVKTPWGIEVARGRITSQAIEVINHLERVYTIYNYTSLQEKWGFPCNYAFIQALLLGKLPADFSHLEEKKANAYTTILQRKGEWILEAIINDMIGKVERWEMVNELTQDRCSIHYQQLTPYPAAILFKHTQLEIGHLSMHITYTQVQGCKKKLMFPFRIPEKYAKL